MSKPIELNKLVWEAGQRTGPTTEQDMFGVEIEVEGVAIPTRNNAAMQPYWHCGQDGSLRTLKDDDLAIEYKFRQALNMPQSIAAINILCDRLNSPGTTCYPSPRCSVHVHVNVALETMRTLYNFITLAFILEEVLVEPNGKNRIGNNFCLRLKDAEGMMISLVQSMKSHGHLWAIHPDARYSATNLCSLYRFSTIEFRSLEFTTDSNRIINWMKVLNKIKVAARDFRDPIDIVQKFSEKGPRRFMLDIIGAELSGPYILQQGVEQKLWSGVSLVQEFAYCSRWQQKEAQKPANRPKHSPIDTTDVFQTWTEVPLGVVDNPLQWEREPPPTAPAPPPRPEWGVRPARINRIGDIMYPDDPDVV